MLLEGDVAEALARAPEAAARADGPLADAVVGRLSLLLNRTGEAEEALRSARDRCEPARDTELAADIAMSLALLMLSHGGVVSAARWSRRAVALAAPEGMRARAVAVLVACLLHAGRTSDALAALDGRRGSAGVKNQPERSLTDGGLRIVGQDIERVRGKLAAMSERAAERGWLDIAVCYLACTAHLDYVLGAWFDAVLHAERAIAIAEGCGLRFGLAQAHAAAVGPLAGRGDWVAAERHLRAAAEVVDGVELWMIATAIARAQFAAAQGEPEGVIAALEPVRCLSQRDGIDELEIWLWHDLYAEALLGLGLIDDAAAFLEAREALAKRSGTPSTIARLARARGLIEAARGHIQEAEVVFMRSLKQLDGLWMPFEYARLQYAYGQLLRRAGRRQAASGQIRAARASLAMLGADPYVERCDRELVACGLSPAKRREFDPNRLTPQEHCIAALVATGRTNREVAMELMLSVKTVEFHLTHIYRKTGVSSRAQLAARLNPGRSPGSTRLQSGAFPGARRPTV